ncbi:hypothetical protein AAFF_G00359230 [Aldrovandia affinis]|uniref:Uncharacterized protein n=1 Tax=Aldrovandia affinis TaxID=143900 RepID=A0AAD7SI41_9TELE|nr:hypothetical protein AAFF_G00359230 [Aldrovandia affinis]
MTQSATGGHGAPETDHRKLLYDPPGFRGAHRCAQLGDCVTTAAPGSPRPARYCEHNWGRALQAVPTAVTHPPAPIHLDRPLAFHIY